MFSKGIAIIAITKLGVETALKIKETLTKKEFLSIVYAPEKYSKPGVTTLDKKFDEFVRDNYQNFDAIIGVMATGIIIRAVAPLLQSKLLDPAVIGVDASGRFAISLLSGHYGGANELARQIAEGIDATPVVTTASDIMGKQSIDELARVLHLKIENPESLVAVNSAIVNGGKIVLVTTDSTRIPLTAIVGFKAEHAPNTKEATKILNQFDAGGIITQQTPPWGIFLKPVTVLRPLTISIGLGARKEITEEAVVHAVNAALAKAQLPLERVNRIATVSIKKDSQSLINAAHKLGFKLEFVELDTLAKFRHQDLSADSEIVKRNIGVGGVSERAALITAGEKARLILKKTILNGVTVAIAEGE